MSHKTYMSAMNAARKEFKGEWKEKVNIEKVDGLYYVLIKGQAIEDQPGAKELMKGISEAFEEARALGPVEADHSAVAPLSAPSPIPAPIPAPAGWESVETSTESYLNQDPDDELKAAAQALIADAAKAIEEVGEDELERFAEAQRQADAQANAAVVADRNEDAVVKGVWVHKSSTEKPTKKVWHIADAMFDSAEHFARENCRPVVYPTRTEVQNECVRQGIASGTARTQYQHWWKARNDAKVAPIATIGKDGKITMPGKE